jgi:hypothetical protein
MSCYARFGLLCEMYFEIIRFQHFPIVLEHLYYLTSRVQVLLFWARDLSFFRLCLFINFNLLTKGFSVWITIPRVHSLW